MIRMRPKHGFTLIELMITVAIIGILAAIAYPSYQQYVRRAVRSQGQQFLMDIAQRQEQYLLDQRQYAGTLALLGMTVPPELAGKYADPTFGGAPTGSPPTFTITLAPTGGGIMAGDGNLTIDNLQQRMRDGCGWEVCR